MQFFFLWAKPTNRELRLLHRIWCDQEEINENEPSQGRVTRAPSTQERLSKKNSGVFKPPRKETDIHLGGLPSKQIVLNLVKNFGVLLVPVFCGHEKHTGSCWPWIATFSQFETKVSDCQPSGNHKKAFVCVLRCFGETWSAPYFRKRQHKHRQLLEERPEILKVTTKHFVAWIGISRCYITVIVVFVSHFHALRAVSSHPFLVLIESCGNDNQCALHAERNAVGFAPNIACALRPSNANRRVDHI